MEANEIRVGNWLEWNKKPFKVCAIFRSVTENELWAKDNNELHPIPLTEEILLKCGFKYYKESNSYELDCGFSVPIWGKYDSENNLHVSCDEIGIEIHYLHQLQNLYFALTGQELEINL